MAGLQAAAGDHLLPGNAIPDVWSACIQGGVWSFGIEEIFRKLFKEF
jgi:hypothetical protein